jgi:dihydropteroate synthase
MADHQRKAPVILGVVNVTPDSFSDGGQFFDPLAALKQIETLLEHGATYVDIGAESTRPEAKPVPPFEEWSRLEPVLKAYAKAGGDLTRISIDTRHSETMDRVNGFGIGMINCVGEIPSIESLNKLKRDNPALKFAAMHMHGDPSSMQKHPLRRAAARVKDYFESCENALNTAGFCPQDIFVDPGIGFGKTDEANWELIDLCGEWSRKHQLLVGVSRKSFLQRTFAAPSLHERDLLSKAVESHLVRTGVQAVRTHDVAGLVHALRQQGILQGGGVD